MKDKMIHEFMEKLESFYDTDEEACQWLMRTVHAAISDTQAGFGIDIYGALGIETSHGRHESNEPGKYPTSMVDMLKDINQNK